MTRATLNLVTAATAYDSCCMDVGVVGADSIAVVETSPGYSSNARPKVMVT